MHTIYIPKYEGDKSEFLITKVIRNYMELTNYCCNLCVSIPPKLSVSEFVGYLKGKSALMIHDRHPEMTNKWNREFWARGYYVTTIGNINEYTISKYITEQEDESKREDTRI